jgi:ubiquinone/menaquinone biosynthesis C-methylase UbiE
MNRKERRAAGQHGRAAANITSAVDGNEALSIADLMAEARKHYQEGRAAQAQDICNQILALAPSYVHSLNLLGIIAQASGRHNTAVKMFAKALASDELSAACHYNIATSYQALNLRDKASAHFRRAITLGMSDKNIEDFVLQNPVITACIKRINEKWPQAIDTDELFGGSSTETIANDLFLQCALESAPIRGVALEMFLTNLRFALVRFVLKNEKIKGVTVKLFCALAAQCFINEYVFNHGDEEIRQVNRLKDLLLRQLADGSEVSSSLLAAVAAYYPLHSITMAQSLLTRDWPEFVAGLLRQQVREPMEEAKDRSAIPALTAIDDSTSLQVMQQYEENPYPRWTINPLAVLAGERNLRIDAVKNNQPRAGKEILIAGCGTGRQVFQVAQVFPEARVLAVDMSLPSLAYARRKTREEGLRNIEYAQADILKLGTIGRNFDLIEAVGVLHHLREPEVGWRVLVSLLRPKGVMGIGLYSEAARHAIVEVRKMIAERGYRPTAADIRKCRQEIFPEQRLQRVTASNDFYTMSGCRDLLFNVMEHRFTIPDIARFLKEQRLSFLGFNLEPQIIESFQKQFPDASALTDLNLWHEFENANPLTFRLMYIFTVRKD